MATQYWNIGPRQRPISDQILIASDKTGNAAVPKMLQNKYPKKVCPKKCGILAIKSDTRRFLMSYWYLSMENLKPVLFRGGGANTWYNSIENFAPILFRGIPRSV